MRRTKFLGGVAVATAFLLLPASPAHAAAPANDNLASATLITAIPTTKVQSTASSTVQSGESQQSCASAQRTVWFEVKLPQTTPVSVSTYGSSFDTAVAVWTGTAKTFTNLKAVQCNNDMGTRRQSMIGWVAEAGVRYFVQVGGAGSSLTGSLRLRVTYGFRADKADEPIGPQSTAVTLAVGADQDGVDVGMRARESFCYSLFCISIAEVQFDGRIRPSTTPGDAVEDCVRVFAVVIFIIEQCGPL